MAAFSNFLELEILKHVLDATTGVDITPASVYVALATADLTDANTTANEVSVGDYARVQMTGAWTVAEAGGVTTAKNTGAITFPQETQTAYTATHWGIYDASTVGSLLFHGSLDVPKTVGINDTLSFAADALVIETQ